MPPGENEKVNIHVNIKHIPEVDKESVYNS